jgi:signal transduction histidine kinase
VNVLAITSLLASLVILAIGASVLLRDRTRRTYTSFAAFTFMVSAWHLCNFIAMATGEGLAEWLALWPAATIPPTALGFFREFLAEPSIGGKRRPPRFTLAWTLAAYVVLLYSAFFHPIHTNPWFEIPFGAYVFGGLYRCVYDLYIQYKLTATPVEKTRIRYLMLGSLVATTLALAGALPFLSGIWPTIGNVLTILYLYFLSQTLFRYRLLDLNELLGKMLVLGSLVVLLWAVYGLLFTWVGGGQEELFLLNAVVVSFVILVLFEPVRSALENKVNRWIVRQRTELRSHTDKLRRDLANVVEVEAMARLIVAVLKETGRVTHIAVYLIDSDGAGHDRLHYYGPKPPIRRVDVAAHQVFMQKLRSSGFVDIERVRRELGNPPESVEEQTKARGDLEPILELLEKMQAALVVPILGSQETEQGAWLLGMLAVRDDRSQVAFDFDEIDAFRQVANMAARTIESSAVYERVKERDRLAAIGQMAAGLAHEIRNPLGAIKGAAQLLVGPDGKPIAPSDDSAEFMRIIIEEVNRLNKVVTQFLDYARPSRSEAPDYDEVDLNDVIRKTVQLLETDATKGSVELDVRTDDLLPPVAGDPEQLRQVFLNLGLNAIQAMEGGGKLEILTTRRRRSRLGYGSFSEVRFRDNGEGIAPDKLKDLFIPFFTTKQKGTGLGLAISQRIVTQHGGTIEVRSQPGQGSTFSVFLPALGPSRPAEHKRNRSDEVTQPVSGFRAPEAPAGDQGAVQDASE